MSYILAFIASFLIVYVSIPPLQKFAFKINFVDKPIKNNERKIHKKAIPLTAGIAVFIGFLVPFLIFNNFSTYKTVSIVIGSVLIVSIGLIDDWKKTHGKEFPALPKLIVHLVAAILIYSSGILFEGFTSPLSNEYIVLPVLLQFVLTITWIFGVTTVINFSDGIDGLAGVLSVIASMTLFSVALAKGQENSAIMAIILIGVTLAYLKYNKPPAKVFMGDAGATLLGFILAIISLDGAFKQATLLSLLIPILALGVPIFDNLFVILKRIKQGKPIYMADANQIHYRLLANGLNNKQALAFLTLMSISLALCSIIILIIGY